MNRAENPKAHLPAEGRRLPVSTYRLQLQPEFTFDDAVGALDYLEDLGVTDLYLSPILQATPGSTHGYDVVDHSRISEDLGGREGFERLATAAHARGMGVVVDVVPNHMAVPTPLYHNKALWSVLKDGPESPYAAWFDGATSEEGILMPVLGSRIGTVLATGEFAVETMVVPGFEDDGEVPVLRYFDHAFPLQQGTENLPMAALLKRQHYRLAYWKVADEELNYRRFFDVDTLAAVRVEDREVFDATHALLLDLFHAGHIDAFRIDHPDGLADPRGYFRWLSEATDGAWVVAEKILEPDESVPNDWPVAGTTGYDVSWRASTLQVDPGGAADMTYVQQSMTGTEYLPDVIELAKRQVITTSLYAEAHRLATLAADICHSDIRLRDHTFRALLASLVELAIAMDRYRAYVVPGESATSEAESLVREAATVARERLDVDFHETLDVVVDLVLGREVGSAGRIHEDARAELIVRFQQVCGAVTAKGVEDTAFYRWTQLVSLSEVGGNPRAFGITPDEFHSWCASMIRTWPATMSLGSTHDSKRSEDVRSRIGVLSEFSSQWRELLTSLRPLLTGVEGHTENLLWQVLAGTWTQDGPISADRLTGYIVKAAREQKLWTSWTSPDTEAEASLVAQVEALLEDEDAVAALDGWTALTADAVRSSILSTKAIQLTCVGVADNFQGCETTQTYLVDPDNRAPMDVTGLTELLAAARRRPTRSLAAEKIDLTSAILHLRRRRPGAFVGGDAAYKPLASSTGHVVAFARGAEPEVVTVATRLGRSVAQAGGFREHTVVLPEGTWEDIRSGKRYDGGSVPVPELLATCPAAVLERVDE
ncbi:MAG: malto-oligosyltrehalose synthase [Actinobacteria bacterium]|nr:malto-oligosyltrehalose synthase [Actinomycetota bacterium]